MRIFHENIRLDRGIIQVVFVGGFRDIVYLCRIGCFLVRECWLMNSWHQLIGHRHSFINRIDRCC